MSDDTNQRCVRSFIGAYYSGDAAIAAACCADDFDSITYAPVELFPHLGHKHGREWVSEAITIQKARYTARKHDIIFMAAEGPRVATMTRAALTKRSDGRVVQMNVAEFFTLAGGRIVQHRSFFDSFDFVQQVLGRDLTEGFAASVRSAMRT